MKHPLMIKIAFFLAVATGLLFAPAPVLAVTQTFEIQVSASESDAEEDSLGAVNLTDTTLDLGGLYRKVGLRFANITLQKNAPITRAYIEFSTAGQDSANTTFAIEAVAQDNPGVFTTGIFNISTRPVYSEAVNWVMDYAWLTTDEVHQSADITALVQKLVDRSGWASGNAMAFLISNGEDVFRKAKSWNADPAKAPKLHIEYAVNVVDVRVSSATDDIHQSSIAAAYTITNGDNVVLSGSYVYSGFRFQNVNIPQGAVINYACLKFVAKASYAATTGYMMLQGEKRLNPPTFSTVATSTDCLYKRTSGTPVVPKTTNVQWSNNGVWTAGTEYTSVDIKNIIQEIVGQAGWGTSTKSLALNFYYSNPGVNSQQRQVWSYNGDPTKAALLHIEYGQAPAGAGTDPPVISLSSTELGRSAFEGSTAASQHFSLMNSGATALNYTTTVTYNKGSGWLSLTPSTTSGTLGAGEEQNLTVSFNTTGLIAGTYDAIVKFTDANAANSPQEVKVSLAIMPQGAIQCGDIPLYT
jgi:type IV pilus assembly protein PilY1